MYASNNDPNWDYEWAERRMADVWVRSNKAVDDWVESLNDGEQITVIKKNTGYAFYAHDHGSMFISAKVLTAYDRILETARQLFKKIRDFDGDKK